MAVFEQEVRFKAKDDASRVIAGIESSLNSMMGTLAKLAGGALLANFFADGIRSGVEFNAMLEGNRIGIAALLGTYQDFYEGGKKSTDGQAKFNFAMQESAKVQKQLQMAALTTTATFEEMAQGFQAGFGPLVRAGVPVEKTVDAVQRLTQAMSGLRIPTHQLGMEIRQFVAGDTARGAILRGLGISKADVDQAVATGKLYDLIITRTQQFKYAGDAASKSFAGLASNMKDVGQQIIGAGMQPFVDSLKSGMADVFDFLVKIKLDANGTPIDMKFNPDVLAFLNTVGVVLGFIVDTVKGVLVSAFGNADSAVTESGQTWGEVFVKMGGWIVWLIDMVGRGAKAIALAFTHPVDVIEGMFRTLFSGILVYAADFIDSLTPVFDRIGSIASKFGVKTNGSVSGLSQGLRDKAQENTSGADNDTFARFQRQIEGINTSSDSAAAKVKAMLDQIVKGKGPATDALNGLLKPMKDLDALAEAMAIKAAGRQNWAVAFAKGAEAARVAWRKAQTEILESAGRGVEATLEKAQIKIEEETAKIGVAIFNGFLSREEGEGLIQQIVDHETTMAVQKIVESLTEVRKAMADILGPLEQMGLLPKYATEAATGFDGLGKHIAGAKAQLTEFEQLAQGVFDDLQHGLESAFFAILSGKFKDLGDIVKGLGDDIRKTLAKVLSEFVMNWLKTGSILKNSPLVDGESVGGKGALGGLGDALKTWGQTKTGGVVMGGVGGAVAGAGVGSAIGGASGAPGFASGATVGGALGGAIGGIIGGAELGSVYGPIGALIGVIIGGIIGVLMAPNTEKHVEGMVAKTMAQSGVANKIGAGFVGIFHAAGVSIADYFTDWKARLTKMLSGAHYDISAGSNEDLTKNWDWLIKDFLPRYAVQAGFGQIGYGPAGNRDLAGGHGGFDWNDASMDAQGKTITRVLFDPNAPIPKLLLGLGVTAAKVTAIAQQIADGSDIEKIMTYLKGLVLSIVTMQDFAKQFHQKREEIFKDFADKRTASDSSGFEKTISEIRDMAFEMSLLAGQEQVDKAGELANLIQAAREKELEALRRINEAILAFSANVDKAKADIKLFLKFETPAETNARLRGIVNRTPGLIEHATNAAGAQSAAQAGFDAVMALIKNAEDLLTGLRNVGAAFKNLSGEIATFTSGVVDFPAAFAEIKDFGHGLSSIWADVRTAATQTGTDQLATLDLIGQKSRAVFEGIKGFLDQIAQAAKNIHSSIQDQLFGIDQSTRTPGGQATAIQDRIRLLQKQLATTTNPGDAEKITSQIQSLVSTYLGLFGEKDPNKGKAIDWARQVLGETDTVAQTLLGGMKTLAQTWLDELQTQINSATGIVTSGEKAVTDQLLLLAWDLEHIRQTFDTALNKFADDIISTFEPVAKAAEDAATALQSLTNVLTGSEGGENAGTGSGAGGPHGVDGTFNKIIVSGDGVRRVFDELADAWERTKGAGFGPPGGPPRNPGMPGRRNGGTGETTAAVVNALRRFPNLATSGVG